MTSSPFTEGHLKEAFQAKKKDPLKVESPSEETVSK